MQLPPPRPKVSRRGFVEHNGVGTAKVVHRPDLQAVAIGALVFEGVRVLHVPPAGADSVKADAHIEGDHLQLVLREDHGQSSAHALERRVDDHVALRCRRRR